MESRYFIDPVEVQDVEGRMVNGTSYFGDTVEASTSQLKSLFPRHINSAGSGDGKVKHEMVWAIHDMKEGDVKYVTLYDWKEDWESLTEDDKIEFHVGGRGKRWTEVGAKLIEEEIRKASEPEIF